jgi:L-alanine-DL-glutamate epimerase-like enolase superfamily enzyme
LLAESALSIRSVPTCPLSVAQLAPSGRTGFVNSLRRDRHRRWPPRFWRVLFAGIAACNGALWDLLGQKLSAPIYAGPGRTNLRAFASFIGRIGDQQAVAEAERTMRLGLKQLMVEDIVPITYSG